MKNITNDTFHEREMPTIAEFGAAKLHEGFNKLGAKFNKQKSKAEKKVEILSIEAELRKKATAIGRGIIKQIAVNKPPGIDESSVIEVRELLAKKEFLENQIAGGEEK